VQLLGGGLVGGLPLLPMFRNPTWFRRCLVLSVTVLVVLVVLVVGASGAGPAGVRLTVVVGAGAGGACRTVGLARGIGAAINGNTVGIPARSVRSGAECQPAAAVRAVLGSGTCRLPWVSDSRSPLCGCKLPTSPGSGVTVPLASGVPVQPLSHPKNLSPRWPLAATAGSFPAVLQPLVWR